MKRRFVVASGEDAQAEFRAAEALLARLAARAFAAEHPELFQPCEGPSRDNENAGPCLHRCTGRALTPQEGGPAEGERERNGSIVRGPKAE